MKRIALVACLASACTSTAQQGEQPALLVAPSARARAELHDAVSTMLSNPQLMLADDAFTHEATLLLERIPRRDAAGALLNGRELGTPERFTLWVRGTRCLLAHERTGQRRPLRHAQCKPVASDTPAEQ